MRVSADSENDRVLGLMDPLKISSEIGADLVKSLESVGE